MEDPARPDAEHNFSVMIVEDEFLIAMDIEAMLEDNGLKVIGTAASVDGALQLLESTRPDIAVLDGNLRGDSVTPVALRLNELSIPFVLASAYSFKDIDGSDVLAQATNVGKPILEHRLLEALREAMGR